MSPKRQVVMVQFLSIIFFFLDFFNFCWGFQKVPFFVSLCIRYSFLISGKYHTRQLSGHGGDGYRSFYCICLSMQLTCLGSTHSYRKYVGACCVPHLGRSLSFGTTKQSSVLHRIRPQATRKCIYQLFTSG